jgi:acyl dehydratase
MQTVPVEQLSDWVGKPLGPSGWFEITQEQVNDFADATLDHQFIHVNPEAAALTPFGGTIAHGFLTLSLLIHLMEGLQIVPDGTVMGINYGLNKLRFISPVRVGKRVRVAATISDITAKGPGRYLFTYDVTVEIEGEDKPALVVEWLGMSVVG